MKLGSVFDDDFQDIVMFLTKPMKWTPAGPSLRSMTTFPGCPRPCIEIPESDCGECYDSEEACACYQDRCIEGFWCEGYTCQSGCKYEHDNNPFFTGEFSTSGCGDGSPMIAPIDGVSAQWIGPGSQCGPCSGCGDGAASADANQCCSSLPPCKDSDGNEISYDWKTCFGPGCVCSGTGQLSRYVCYCPTTPQFNYKCDGTKCVKDTNGPYTDSNCNNECAKFNCDTSWPSPTPGCFPDDDGPYSSLRECQDSYSCGFRWACDPTDMTCHMVPISSGGFKTESECLADCRRYTCFNGNCVVSATAPPGQGSGLYKTPDCDGNCVGCTGPNGQCLAPNVCCTPVGGANSVCKDPSECCGGLICNNPNDCCGGTKCCGLGASGFPSNSNTECCGGDCCLAGNCCGGTVCCGTIGNSGECCSGSQGNDCCNSAEFCCDGKCASSPDQCCNGKVCETGEVCCDGKCCPSGQTCCGGKCCPADQVCCGGKCCPAGKYCSEGKCCDNSCDGLKFCDGDECCETTGLNLNWVCPGACGIYPFCS